MHLSLFVVDFHLEESSLDGGAAGRLPELPALESLLRQGRGLAPQADWRAALLAGIGLPASPPPSPARVAARLLDLPPGSGIWFAQPVHRVAGLSHVSLHPAGLLRLSPEEAAGWSQDFNRDFAATGLRLHALAPGLLLEGLPAAQGAGDPARLLGAPLPATVPAGSQDRPLRRASAEIEMWLHEHPRNRQRERSGELALNGLWLWGGQGGDLPASALATLPVASGEDPFLRGLWRALGASVGRAERFADLDPGAAAQIVVQSAAAQSLRDRPMGRLEADWFVPLRDALRQRRLRTLRLWFGGRGWEIAPARLFGAVWRRPRPWWRQVSV